VAPPGAAPPRQRTQGVLADLHILAPGGTLLGRLGIGLLLLSVAFFFKYSIDQGWLTEWVRLALGLVAGSVLVGLGFRGAGKGEPLGSVLVGGGIAIFFITGFAGHQWFQLVPYPLAFGFLVAASGLGIFQALRSGRQALGVVGLVGALATPLLLTSPSPEVTGLALYVCLIVASVAALYLARGWRAMLLLAAVTAWPVLTLAVAFASREAGTSLWVLQGALTFCALAFWLVPLLPSALWAGAPARWRRSGSDPYVVPWSVHLDALSLSMPLVGILLSAWLWGLSRFQLGWVFFGGAGLALAVGAWLSRTRDPEGSAGTQRYGALLLSTLGVALVLEGNLLYLAIIAEAAVLLVFGSRRMSPPLAWLGGALEMAVAGVFLARMNVESSFWAGDLTAGIDLVALAGAVIIGLSLIGRGEGRLFLFAAYLGLLGWTARELSPFQQGQAFTSLAFGVEGTAVMMGGLLTNRALLQKVGMATLLLVVGKVLLIDLAAVEPIWRVLLLFLFALLFLVLSKFVQGRRRRASEGVAQRPDPPQESI
jgi:uncharacterized membrane protein